MDYSALLDRIIASDDPLDADELIALEGNRYEIKRRLDERKLKYSDETLTGIEDAVAARLRTLGV